MFYCYGVSEKGNTRKRNEDAFMINRIILSHSEIEGKAENPFIVAVAECPFNISRLVGSTINSDCAFSIVNLFVTVVPS